MGPGVSCTGMGRFSGRAWGAGAGAAANASGADTLAVPPETRSRLTFGADLLSVTVVGADDDSRTVSPYVAGLSTDWARGEVGHSS